MIVVVDIEESLKIDTSIPQPGAIVHTGGVGFGCMTDHELRVLKAEIGTMPVAEVVQIVDSGR